MRTMKIVILTLMTLIFAVSGRAQAAPPEAAKPKVPRVRMGGNQTAKMLKHKVNPSYPQDARQQGIQGTVRVHVVIGQDGKVMSAEAISGPKELLQSTIDAVHQWEYRPVTLNGQTVEVDTVVDVAYSLER